MVTRNAVRKIGFSALLMLVCICMAAPIALAQEEDAEEEGGADGGNGLSNFGIALSAGLAVALCGLATAMAQAAVGAGGTAAMAEKPELFANVLILFAIPETIVILGFVIAFLLLGKIG